MDATVGGGWKADMHFPDGRVIHWPHHPLAASFTGRVIHWVGEYTEAQAVQTVIGYNGFFDAPKLVLAEQDAAVPAPASSTAAPQDSPGSVEEASRESRNRMSGSPCARRSGHSSTGGCAPPPSRQPGRA